MAGCEMGICIEMGRYFFSIFIDAKNILSNVEKENIITGLF